ncbi:MAG: hypothetical protein HKN09_06940 [Saprospiraceae bacterium]|nr:hypothetical protein [Saprospiraceae bacterium]
MNYELFLDGLHQNQQLLIEIINQQLLSFPEITRKMRYKIPFYDYKSWICYLNPVKPDKVEMCYFRGKQLSNVQGLLEDRGRKLVSGVMLEDPRNLPMEALLDIFAEAVILDEEVNKKKS